MKFIMGSINYIERRAVQLCCLILTFLLIMIFHGRPLPSKTQSCQVAQRECKWSGDELQNGPNNKEMIILEIKYSKIAILRKLTIFLTQALTKIKKLTTTYTKFQRNFLSCLHLLSYVLYNVLLTM